MTDIAKFRLGKEKPKKVLTPEQQKVKSIKYAEKFYFEKGYKTYKEKRISLISHGSSDPQKNPEILKHRELALERSKAECEQSMKEFQPFCLKGIEKAYKEELETD